MLTLKMEEGPQAKEYRWLPKTGKGNRFSLEPPEKGATLPTLNLAQ